MGLRTVVIINNDAFNDITDNPKEFVQEINRAMNQTRSAPRLWIGGCPVGCVVECVDTSSPHVLIVDGIQGRGYAALDKDFAPNDDAAIIKAIAKAHGFQITLRPTPERIRQHKKPGS